MTMMTRMMRMTTVMMLRRLPASATIITLLVSMPAVRAQPAPGGQAQLDRTAADDFDRGIHEPRVPAWTRDVSRDHQVRIQPPIPARASGPSPLSANPHRSFKPRGHAVGYRFRWPTNEKGPAE
jgi:hypothetical protein